MIIKPTTEDGGSPPSRKIHLIVAQVVCMGVTIIIVGLRLYARAMIQAVGTDDWLILLALFFAILFTVCICVSTAVGWTYHLEDVDDKIPALTVAFRADSEKWIAQLLFTPAVSTVKLSILTFYLRLSTSRTFRYFVFGGMIFVALWFISFETVIAMTCDTPNDPVGFTGSRLDHCVSNRPTTKYHGITNILTDFFVYFLPIPLLWGLNMPPKRRLGLIFVFAVGGIVCIFGTLRLIFSLTVDVSSDYTWEGFYLWLFAALELDLGIICASAPALKMFVVRTIQSSSENETVQNIAQPTPPRISQFIGNNVRNEGLTSLCSVEVSVGSPEEMTMPRNSMYGMRSGILVPKRNSDIVDDEIQEVQGEQGEGSGGITKTVEFSFHEESTSNGDGSDGSQRGSTSRAGSTVHSG
ncbi:hypothetical protein BKA65DRAFT_481201 [Rhexocercosporidium sp. MPI-PUGE-AT-0058]|nr:hypothetical protein BKA65DRAFT_481201 [Rhexocercosporidium sp. MPI-PUGE-AT-0058]